jgi:tellurite resistance protein TehA-like permease
MDSFQQHIVNSLIPIAIFIFSFGTMAYTNYRNGKATGNKRLKGLGIMYLVFLIGGLLIIGVMFYLEYRELAFDMAAQLLAGKIACWLLVDGKA